MMPTQVVACRASMMTNAIPKSLHLGHQLFPGQRIQIGIHGIVSHFIDDHQDKRASA
jgi:hypothetical protein